jgi:hypothetical protein
MSNEILCMQTIFNTTLNTNNMYDVDCITRIVPLFGRPIVVRDVLKDKNLEDVLYQESIALTQKFALQLFHEETDTQTQPAINSLETQRQDDIDLIVTSLKDKLIESELLSQRLKSGQTPHDNTQRIGLIQKEA